MAPYKKLTLLRRSVFLMLVVLLNSGSAAEYSGQFYYRYVDADGETVIATQVPKEAARRGYEVLTESGRVLEIVAPELSEEALQIQKFQKQLQLQKQLREKIQSEDDDELLRLYSTVDDVEFAMRRLIQEIDTRALVLVSKQERLRLQQERRQVDAADAEREGRKVPENLTFELQNLASELVRVEAQIQELEKEKDKVRADYAIRAERVRFLLEGEEVARNKRLLLSKKQLLGRWVPVARQAGLAYWQAEEERFILQLFDTPQRNERLVGKWSLNRDKDIVVVFFRQETSQNGNDARKSVAKEERYPVLDMKGGVLNLYWRNQLVKFRKADKQ